jgi:predicted TIM-barrel fold metal-dependent hydrolase
MHVYDERFPAARPDSRMQANAGVHEYRLLQQRIGTTRTVVVTPAAYVTDNRVTLDAIAQLGREKTRGIAVVFPQVTDKELEGLAEGGIRGIRFTVFDPNTAATSIEMIEPLSNRVHQFGWHVQIHMRGEQIVEHEALLNRLPSAIVIDHMGRAPQPEGASHKSFAIVRSLLDRGRTWVKLSGAYMDGKIGPPSYADVSEVAKAYLKAAPERCVWGSDWPHPTEHNKPDDAILFDLILAWTADEKMQRRLLVENPERLYGFGSAA